MDKGNILCSKLRTPRDSKQKNAPQKGKIREGQVLLKPTLSLDKEKETLGFHVHITKWTTTKDIFPLEASSSYKKQSEYEKADSLIPKAK